MEKLELFTGENKKQFKGWYQNDYYLNNERASTYARFMRLPIQEQIGVIDKYLLSKKTLIEVKPIDDWTCWIFEIYLEDLMSPFFKYSDSGDVEYKTKEEAFKEAFKVANNIINEKI